MSKLLISNSLVVASRFKNRCVEGGFAESVFKSSRSLSLSSFKKLKVDNVNYYEDGDSFVAICGSLVYKEAIGAASLALLLKDFSQDRDVKGIRDNSLGNYLCVICHDGMITSFCDSRNVHELYYYHSGSEWTVSGSLFEMAISIGKGLITVNEDALLEEMYSRCIWGDETVFNEIKRLNGDEFLTINLDGGCLHLHEIRPDIKFNEGNFEDSVKSFSAELARICTVVRKVYPSLSIAMTGGMDSRSVLAGLLSSPTASSGQEPHSVSSSLTLLYGIGNSQLIETRNEDKLIIEKIAEEYKLAHAYMDWTTPEIINQSWDELSGRFGFLGRVYSGSPYLHGSLLGRDESFIAYGYFGESYSFEDTLLKESFSLEDFLDFYIGNRVKSIAPDYQRYRNHISDKIKTTLRKYGIESETLSINDWIVLELEMRRKKDTVMVRLSNQHRYSFAILGEESLLRYAFCPVEFKKNRRFLLNMMRINSPGLLDIPIFSHGEYRAIDKDRFELKTTMAMRGRDLVKKVIKDNKVRQLAVMLYKKIQGGEKGREETQKINSTSLQLKALYSEMAYQPHNIFSEASTNLTLEARFVYTVRLLQDFSN